MTIASPTRSSRSARITTSAASMRPCRRRPSPRAAARAGASCSDLVGWNAIGARSRPRRPVGEHRDGPDRLRRIGAVAGDHHDAAHSSGAQHADGVRRLGAQFVGQEERADRALLHGNEDHQRRSPRGAAHRPQDPFVDMAVRHDHVRGARTDPLAVDHLERRRISSRLRQSRTLTPPLNSPSALISLEKFRK